MPVSVAFIIYNVQTWARARQSLSSVLSLSLNEADIWVLQLSSQKSDLHVWTRPGPKHNFLYFCLNLAHILGYRWVPSGIHTLLFSSTLFHLLSYLSKISYCSGQHQNPWQLLQRNRKYCLTLMKYFTSDHQHDNKAITAGKDLISTN